MTYLVDIPISPPIDKDPEVGSYRPLHQDRHVKKHFGHLTGEETNFELQQWLVNIEHRQASQQEQRFLNSPHLQFGYNLWQPNELYSAL